MATIRVTIDWTFDEDAAHALSEEQLPIEDFVSAAVDGIREYAETEGIESAVQSIQDTSGAFEGAGVESGYVIDVERIA